MRLSRCSNTRALLTLTLALAVTASCGGGGTEPPVTTPAKLAHGIIAGNGQTARAGTTELSQGVTERMTMAPDGTASLRPVDPVGERLLDWLVPRAFAQTTVKGSPVLGAVVCAVPTTERGLTPFNPCTNTDANGDATFFFAPGTKAGEARVEIRGTITTASTVLGQPATIVPAVFDTAKAIITAGEVKDANVFNRDTLVRLGDTLTLAGLVYTAFDAYGNQVPSGSYRLGYRRQNINAAFTDPATIIATSAVIRTGDYALQIMLDSIGKSVGLRLRVP